MVRFFSMSVDVDIPENMVLYMHMLAPRETNCIWGWKCKPHRKTHPDHPTSLRNFKAYIECGPECKAQCGNKRLQSLRGSGGKGPCIWVKKTQHTGYGLFAGQPFKAGAQRVTLFRSVVYFASIPSISSMTVHLDPSVVDMS